jgi:hypothetical protein
MARAAVLLVIGTLILIASAEVASARDGRAFRGGAVAAPSRIHEGWRAKRHRHRGPSFPFYLQGRTPDVNVVIAQTFVAAPLVPPVPGLLDVPVSAGIREERPARAAVIVLNGRSETVAAGSVRLRSGGARILTAERDGSTAPEVGARVIHVSVPGGR